LVDVAQGRLVGTMENQGTTPEVSWLRGGSTTPLLLVATEAKLNTFNVATRPAAGR